MGVDLSQNNLQRWPEEYFYRDIFLNLEFCNVNFNTEVTVEPEICKRTHYCFKQAVLQSRDMSSASALGEELDEQITRSKDTFEYPHV